MTTEEIIAWKKNFPNILEKARSKANRHYPSILEIDDDAEFGEYDINEAKRAIFIEGYLEADKDLGWRSVEESLPEIDEEVIALTNQMNGKTLDTARRICYAHRPNPKGWDGRSLDTGEVKHYDVVTYDGWNIPGVRYWMPCPKIPEE